MKTPQLPNRVEDWPAEWLEQYEERAAIIEFLGNRPREEAERTAERVIRWQFQEAQ